MSNFQSKAIKFYSLDLCFNKQRLDSWAAMALAHGSELEMKLNSVIMNSTRVNSLELCLFYSVFYFT